MATIETKKITLPITGNQFTDGGYTVKGYKELTTRNGITFTVTVYRYNKRVGTIENQGNGGGTTFSADSGEEYRNFQNWVSDNKEAGETDYTAEERICDIFADEAQFAKDIARLSKKNYIFGMIGDFYGEKILDIGSIGNGQPVVMPSKIEEIPAQVIELAKKTNARIWSTNGWLTIE